LQTPSATFTRVRTTEARGRAKARGAKMGLKPKLTLHQQRQAQERLNSMPVEPGTLAGIRHATVPALLPTQPFSIGSYRLPKRGHRGVLGTQCQKSHCDDGRSYPIEPCECEAALRHRQTRRA
jgi:hypothetical protein